MTHKGEVVKWADSKGIGFINCQEFTKDVYVHHTAFGGGSLRVGRPVEFDISDDDGGRRAINVKGEAVMRGEPRRRSRSRSRERHYERRGQKVFVVKLRYLDPDVDEEDIMNFFEDEKVDIVDSKLLMDREMDTAFVQLYTQRDFDIATSELNGKRLVRGCFARVYRSGDRDYMEAKNRMARGGRRRRRRSSSSRSYSRSRTPERRRRRGDRDRKEARSPRDAPSSRRRRNSSVSSADRSRDRARGRDSRDRD